MKINHFLYAFLLLIAAGSLSVTYAQTGKPSSFTSQLKETCRSSRAPDVSMIYLLRKLTKDDFPTEDDWLTAITQMDSVARESSGEYYAQFASEAAAKLYHSGEFQEAYYYITKARTTIGKSLPKDKRFLWRYHQTLGLLYYYFKNFEAAKQEFYKLERYVKEIPEKDRIGQLNTLGLIAREQANAAAAIHYFEEALKLARKTDHLPWIAVLSGNLGEQFYKKGMLDTAEVLIEKDYNYSLQTGQPSSAMNAVAILVEIALKRNNLAQARAQMKLLEDLVMEHRGTSDFRVYYRTLTKLQQATGDYKDALESYKLERKYLDTIQKRSDAENMRKTEFRVNFEKEQSEVSLLNEKKKRNELAIYGLTGLIIIVLTGASIIINLTNKRRKQAIEIAHQKQLSIEREKRQIEREMRITLENLIEKNELIEELNAEIEHFQSDRPEPVLSEEKIRLKERLQSFTLLTEDDWQSFKRLFEQLNPGFFERVHASIPEVTNAELRLVTLIKLNLDKTEMSKALGISPDSVRKTSLRLRKKLGMEHQEDLVRFSMSL